jgi:cytochrome c553
MALFSACLDFQGLVCHQAISSRNGSDPGNEAGRPARPQQLRKTGVSHMVTPSKNLVARSFSDMNRRLLQSLAAATLAVCVPAGAQEGGDPEAGRGKAWTCMGCHAAPGMRNASPVYRVPMLGGQHTEYLVAALTAYKNKERAHPTMQAQAIPMSAKDIADVAAFFAGLEE